MVVVDKATSPLQLLYDIDELFYDVRRDAEFETQRRMIYLYHMKVNSSICH